MIYYPLSILMLSGIKRSSNNFNPDDLLNFKKLIRRWEKSWDGF